MATFAVSEPKSAAKSARKSGKSWGLKLSLTFDHLPIVLQMPRRLNDEAFERFSRAHEPLRVEMLPNGDISVMTPVDYEGARLNARLTMLLGIWNEQHGGGVVLDSSVGFRMPDNAVLSPDASWMSRAKHDAIPPGMRHKFVRVCPEFIIELRSTSDRLPPLQRKMEKWIANGAQLAWLIDPQQKQATIYRPGKPPEVLPAPTELKGEKPVEGFVLPMQEFWA